MDSAGLLPLAARADAMATAIAAAPDRHTLAGLAAQARELAVGLATEQAGAGLVTGLLSVLNDRITARVLALRAPAHRLPPAGWCWLGLGSEGRLEQTFVTDQDNGLLFSAGSAAEAKDLRERLLPFAQAVNEDLAACGFALCPGEIMAGNPRWCLSLDEWRDCFSAWVRTPEPEALLNASIFFDFRSLAGDDTLAVALRADLLALTQGNDLFLRMMTANALAAQPPLGRLRDFVTDEDHTLDLKKFGSRIFVDAARILALGAGSPATATAARLAEADLPGGDGQAAIHAFHAIQQLRLAVGGNRVTPDRLNEFDRRVLHAALLQARNLQQGLKARYHIET